MIIIYLWYKRGGGGKKTNVGPHPPFWAILYAGKFQWSLIDRFNELIDQFVAIVVIIIILVEAPHGRFQFNL